MRRQLRRRTVYYSCRNLEEALQSLDFRGVEKFCGVGPGGPGQVVQGFEVDPGEGYGPQFDVREAVAGTSIRGEFPARSGNNELKNALFRSAWIASCHDPVSKTYYERKRAEGKNHNAAVICLARRRCDVLFAKLKTEPYYLEKTPETA